jgi:hypothetical protein
MLGLLVCIAICVVSPLALMMFAWAASRAPSRAAAFMICCS